MSESTFKFANVKRCPQCDVVNPDEVAVCVSCGASLEKPSNDANEAESSDAKVSLSSGTALRAGYYVIDVVIGQGGNGITYKATDTKLNRPVAIKEYFPFGCTRLENNVQPHQSSETDKFIHGRDRFFEESQALARFDHPGIVHVFSTFEENNTAYMVMELLEGRTLQSILDEKKRLYEKQVVQLAQQIGGALSVIHQKDMLHRDVKPENIIFTTDKRFVLVDFGSAREFSSDQIKTMTTTVTQGYAPLEQYAKKSAQGPFTDIYSLGATLYHCLTGKIPPSATDRMLKVPLIPPREINTFVSEQINNAIIHALQIKAEDRPQNVLEFINALSENTSHSPTATPPVVPPEINFSVTNPSAPPSSVPRISKPTRPNDVVFLPDSTESTSSNKKWILPVLAGVALLLIVAFGVRQIFRSVRVQQTQPVTIAALPEATAQDTTDNFDGDERNVVFSYDPVGHSLYLVTSITQNFFRQHDHVSHSFMLSLSSNDVRLVADNGAEVHPLMLINRNGSNMDSTKEISWKGGSLSESTSVHMGRVTFNMLFQRVPQTKKPLNLFIFDEKVAQVSFENGDLQPGEENESDTNPDISPNTNSGTNSDAETLQKTLIPGTKNAEITTAEAYEVAKRAIRNRLAKQDTAVFPDYPGADVDIFVAQKNVWTITSRCVVEDKDGHIVHFDWEGSVAFNPKKQEWNVETQIK